MGRDGQVETEGCRAGRFGRRGLLAAMPLLAAPPALARSLGGALTDARRAGRLRVGITAWMQLPARPPLPPDAPPHDPFSEALARRLAGALGLRAEVEYMSFSGEALSWLSQGMLDVALAPVYSRFTAREVMFARPHLAIDLVVVAPREARARRRLSEWTGERLAVIPGFLNALEDMGQPTELLRTVPVGNLVELERAVLQGRAFGAIVTSLQGQALRERNPQRDLLIRTALAIQPLAAAVAFGQHDLLRAVDQAVMLALEQGEVAALFREAHGRPFPPLGPFQ